MKEHIKTAAFLLFSLLLAFSCDIKGENTDDNPVNGIAVESVFITSDDLVLAINGTVQLNATVVPSDAENKDITWSSSDTSMVTVSDTGMVTALSEGTVTITVTTTDGGFTAAVVITVTHETERIAVSSVKIDQSDLELIVDRTGQMTSTVLPSNAEDKSVTWSSSDTDIATVTNSGRLTAIAVGNTTITVTTTDGSYTDTCNVKIIPQPVAVSSVSLDNSNISLVTDETEQLNATVLPSNATEKSVLWSSGDISIATVSDSGFVTAISEGTTFITVNTTDGSFTDSCQVFVSSAVEYPAGAFASVWDMSLTDTNTLDFPLVDDGNYDFTIDWGDGTVESYTNADVSHTYDTAAKYTVIVTGVCEGFGFSSFYSEMNEENLVDIGQWGSVKLNNESYKFADCTNLTGFTATDEPDLEGITNLRNMFKNATLFNGDISGWDTSSVTNMVHMFSSAHAFNQDISDWDTSNVTLIYGMFYGAREFNQNISSWDISKVTRLAVMFSYARAFNQDISNWDTSNITDMGGMFDTAESFNQDLSNWDTSSVTDMAQMFTHTKVFNGDISAWDTSSVTTMYHMFSYTDAFNGDISGWDTSNVTYMRDMFDNAIAFNRDISGWDTSKVNNMIEMFNNAESFTNGDNPAGLESWTIDSECEITGMFRNCPLSPRPSWY